MLSHLSSGIFFDFLILYDLFCIHSFTMGTMGGKWKVYSLFKILYKPVFPLTESTVLQSGQLFFIFENERKNAFLLYFVLFRNRIRIVCTRAYNKYIKHAKTSKICDVKQATAFDQYIADKNNKYIKKAHVKANKNKSILNSFMQKSY